MSTFALATVKSVGEVEAMLPVPASIRGLALLSQLAVYKDIIPGKSSRMIGAGQH
jgi:nucleolar complex protein 3